MLQFQCVQTEYLGGIFVSPTGQSLDTALAFAHGLVSLLSANTNRRHCSNSGDYDLYMIEKRHNHKIVFGMISCTSQLSTFFFFASPAEADLDMLRSTLPGLLVKVLNPSASERQTSSVPRKTCMIEQEQTPHNYWFWMDTLLHYEQRHDSVASRHEVINFCNKSLFNPKYGADLVIYSL